MTIRIILRIISWVLLLGSLALWFSGCVLSVQDRMERKAAMIAEIVNTYCTETTDPNLRAAFRAAVNDKTKPHLVRVTCAQLVQPEPEQEQP